ncbi:MAG: hypothetical protein ACPGJV_09870 [Bacteriovoracaceae bacterium]
MWKVEFESPKVEKEVEELVKKKKLSSEDRIVIAAWIRQISEEGPESIQGERRWDDHELYDNWKGYRSSCFSNSGRIIYKIEDQVIKILIARITPEHDYKR